MMPLPRTLLLRASTLAALLALAACGGEKSPPATQVAAKVNKEEISVHQINFVLQRQPNLKPEQAESAGRQVLERLIDQEVAVQKAQEQKLDRDPRVMQELEAARREIIARAYVGKVGEAVSKPTPEEIRAYYDSKPALFAQRRIYTLQEVLVEADAAQVAALQERLAGFKSLQELGDYLRQQKLPARSSQNTTAAEALPMHLLERFATLKEGQTTFTPVPRGVRLVTVLQTRDAPVTEEQARPAIEQFLLNERKRRAVEQDMKSIRTAAHVEYVGQFAAPAPAASAASAETAEAGEPAAPSRADAPAPAASSPALDANALNKGLAGLK